ncbi:MAG: hypothetical protein JOZ49_10725 [Mycolicibacterium sp.]|nr:hypothetical protein [Mycolicibacterium sp.]
MTKIPATAKNVTDVRRNNGRNPKGSSFTREVNIDATQRNVTVVFHDDNGTTYPWTATVTSSS